MLIAKLARTAVHFQDVQEKYTPYETLIEISTAEGLNDTSLAASFPLHTATPSASSSRLNEISEDAEDGGQTPLSQHTISSYFRSQRHRPGRRSGQSPPPSKQVRSETPPLASPVSSPLSSPKKTSVSQFLVREDSGQRSITSLMSPSLASTTEYTDSEASSKETQPTENIPDTPDAITPTLTSFKPLPDAPTELPKSQSHLDMSPPRTSRNTEVRIPTGMPERPITDRSVTSSAPSETPSVSERYKYDDDPYDFSKFDIKPKVKLGPRPVAATEKSKRPSTASISSVPAGLRSMTKKQEQPRPKSQGPLPGLVPPVLPPPPIPDVPEYNPRPLSRGSVKSLPSHKSTAMTPDKIRLMKAVELRKKQLRKSNPQPDTFVLPPDEEVPAVPKVTQQPPGREVERVTQKPAQVDTVLQEEQQALAKKPDSGIAMEYQHTDKPANDDVNNETQAEHPNVSVAEPSQPQEKETDRSRDRQSPITDNSHVSSSQNLPQPQEESAPVADVREEEDTSSEPLRREAAVVEMPQLEQITGPAVTSTSAPDEAVDVPKIVMADGSRPISASIKQAHTEESSPAESDAEFKSADESASSNDELEPPEKNIRRQPSDIAKRRRGYVEPLRLDGDEDFMSDDEFMEELQSATFQQAKPMTVAKSPVPHYVPRRPSATSAISDFSVSTPREERAFETPLDFAGAQDMLIPEPATDSRGHSRSASTPPGERSDPMSSLRRDISSGISKRIQALADRSSQEYSRSGSPIGTPLSQETSPSGPSVKDQRDTAKSPPPNHARASSFRVPMSRHSSKMSMSQTSLAASAAPQPEPTTAWNSQHIASQGLNSVSVTARIVRPNPIEQTDSATETEGELQPSQLVISHKRGTPSQPTVPKLHRLDTNPNSEPLSRESTTSRGDSPTMTRNPADQFRTLHSANNSRQIRSPLSPTADDFPPPPINRTLASYQATGNDENAAPKEGTRTSRFFKRMSNFGGKRRSGGLQSVANSSSPVSERNASLPGSKDKPELPPALVVGDLNIQFPDSLVSLRQSLDDIAKRR